jgi:hypothetical protein
MDSLLVSFTLFNTFSLELGSLWSAMCEGTSFCPLGATGSTYKIGEFLVVFYQIFFCIPTIFFNSDRTITPLRLQFPAPKKSSPSFKLQTHLRRKWLKGSLNDWEESSLRMFIFLILSIQRESF